MRGIDIDDVKTRFPGTQCCRSMPAAEITDVLLVHGTGLKWVTVHIWHVADAQRYFSSQQVSAAGAAGP